jgi:UDP-N-acetylmuramate dehydrogenase
LVIQAYAREHNIPVFILGNGSNLLVADNGIRGIVIAVGESETYFQQKENLFSVSASYSLPKFVLESLKLGYEGLEATAGVPATIGGATKMNAGAYGTEVFDHIHSVKFIRNGIVMERLKNEIDFSYRHTEFENDIILETTFTLNKASDIGAVSLKRKELLEKRKDAQPLDKPNTGSVFKNPLPLHAGKLIEDAGLKGYVHSNVQVSPKHANFIVNNGGATAKEFMELVNYIIKTVKEKFNVSLETEVLQVGEFPLST